MALSAYFIGSNQQTSGTVLTITPGTASNQGDTIVILMGNSGSTQPTTITDTQGNVYSAAAAANVATPDAVAWEATNTNALATTDTITLTFPSGANGQNKTAYAVGGTGFDASVSLNILAVAQGSGTSPALTTSKLSIPNQIAFAVLVNGNGGGAPGTFTGGWTQQSTTIHNASAQYTSVFTQVTSSVSALSFGATIVSAPWSIVIITVTGPSAAVQVSFNESYCFAASAVPGAAVAVTFSEHFSFSVNQGGATTNPVVVNVTQYQNLSNYGLSAIPIANTTGNALVVLAAWNGAEVNPVANVSDDAHNFWTHGGTSSVSGEVRCAVWIAPNAQAATNLSVGLSWFAQALTIIVAEVQNMPLWAQVDYVATNFGNNVGTLVVSGTATAPDFTFGCVVASPVEGVLSRNQGWNFIGQTTAQGPFGQLDPATTQIQAVWQVTQPGAVTAQWTPTASGNMAGILVGFKQAPTAPVQPNPNYPGMHIEMALGYQPGDPTQVPSWTDVTQRAINDSGQTALKSSRGRQYESEAPEAGDLVINMRNNDGALTPGNASSPFYPNVLLGTQVRVWATWNNRAYAVQQGYVERFPQTWPDNPQYGIVPMEAVDALDPLSNSVLPSALGGDILTDLPYGYWACGDTYLQDQAAGLPLANLARTNQRPMVATDATFLTGTNPQVFNRYYLQTGLQWQTSVTGQIENFLGLPGDSSTGIGFIDTSNQSISKAGVAVTPVPGAFYQAPDMPQTPTGVTVEFWAIVDKSFEDANHLVELLRIAGNPPNYYYNHDRGCRMAVRVGEETLSVEFFGFSGDTYPFTFSSVTPTDGNYHQYAVSVMKVSGQFNVAVYMDGQPLTPLGGSNTTGLTTPNDWNFLGLGGTPHNDGGIAYGYIYTAGQAALFPSVVTAARIKSHYNSGNSAGVGDDTVTRMAKLLTWGGFGLARSAAPPSPSPLLGLADQISGTSVADAANTIATTDGGMFFVDGAGNATWWPRTFLYNRPVKWTLGDNPGETPYDPGEEYDFDNTFIQNTVQIQRQLNSQTQGAIIAVADQASQKQYFIRPGTQTTIETTSDEDAFDQAEWTITKYKQPNLRVQQVVLNPVTNTAVWPVALGIEQGDIAMLTRRPLGGAVISQKCIVQSVAHETGPDKWETTINLIPYAIESGVLVCDTSGFNVVGSNGIGW